MPYIFLACLSSRYFFLFVVLSALLSPSLGFPFPLCFFCVFFVRVFSLVAPVFPVPFPLSLFPSFPLSLFPSFPLSHALSYPLIGTPYLLRLRPHPHHYISPHTGTDIRSVSVAADGCRDGDMLFCAWGPCMYGMWGYAGEYGQEKPECRICRRSGFYVEAELYVCCAVDTAYGAVWLRHGKPV